MFGHAISWKIRSWRKLILADGKVSTIPWASHLTLNIVRYWTNLAVWFSVYSLASVDPFSVTCESVTALIRANDGSKANNVSIAALISAPHWSAKSVNDRP